MKRIILYLFLWLWCLVGLSFADGTNAYIAGIAPQGTTSGYGLQLDGGDIVKWEINSTDDATSLYALVKFSKLSTSDRRLWSFYYSSTRVLYATMETATKGIRLNQGTGSSTVTTDTVSTGTTYHILMTYDVDGTYSLEFNTSGVFSGDGDDYTGNTNGSYSNQVQFVYFEPQTAADLAYTVDDIRVDTATSAVIGDYGACDGACDFEEDFNGSTLCFTGFTSNCEQTVNNALSSPDFQGTDLE